jgi:hypothetical protein
VSVAQFNQARASARKIATKLGGTAVFKPAARAASALATAFDCADGESIDVADRAWSLATEATTWMASGGLPGAMFKYLTKGDGTLDGGPWWQARLAVAELRVRPLFKPLTDNKQMATDLAAAYASPPPGAPNTNHVSLAAPPLVFNPTSSGLATVRPNMRLLQVYGMRADLLQVYGMRAEHSKGYGNQPIPLLPLSRILGNIVQPVAQTPPGTWGAGGTKNWIAYGTDDASLTPTSRSAFVSDSNGNEIGTGAYATPPNGYTWAFSFTNLTPNATVSVTVQWNYTAPQPSTSQSVTAVVVS